MKAWVYDLIYKVPSGAISACMLIGVLLLLPYYLSVGVVPKITSFFDIGYLALFACLTGIVLFGTVGFPFLLPVAIARCCLSDRIICMLQYLWLPPDKWKNIDTSLFLDKFFPSSEIKQNIMATYEIHTPNCMRIFGLPFIIVPTALGPLIYALFTKLIPLEWSVLFLSVVVVLSFSLLIVYALKTGLEYGRVLEGNRKFETTSLLNLKPISAVILVSVLIGFLLYTSGIKKDRLEAQTWVLLQTILLLIPLMVASGSILIKRKIRKLKAQANNYIQNEKTVANIYISMFCLLYYGMLTFFALLFSFIFFIFPLTNGFSLLRTLIPFVEVWSAMMVFILPIILFRIKYLTFEKTILFFSILFAVLFSLWLTLFDGSITKLSGLIVKKAGFGNHSNIDLSFTLPGCHFLKERHVPFERSPHGCTLKSTHLINDFGAVIHVHTTKSTGEPGIIECPREYIRGSWISITANKITATSASLIPPTPRPPSRSKIEQSP